MLSRFRSGHLPFPRANTARVALLTLVATIGSTLLAADQVDASKSTTTQSSTPSTHPKEALKKSVSIKVKLRSGARVHGLISSFDGEGIDGEGVIEIDEPKPKRGKITTDFKRLRWTEIATSDLETLAERVLDERQADDLVLQGELMLLIGADASATKAFVRAVKLDPATKPAVELARTRATAAILRVETEERVAKSALMSERIPKSGAQPWPVLTLDEQLAAIAEMKTRAQTICSDAGIRPNMVETRYFLLFSAAEPAAMQECARSLDAMYEKVLELFGIPAGLNLFWGKAVILLEQTEDGFRAVEAAGFKSMTPRGVVGLCHQMGPMVFVNMFWSNDQDRFDSTLIHETVHGIMHRYFSAERLPAWADEGLSEYIASVSFKSSPVDKGRLPQALDYIRSGRSVAAVMRLNYDDRSWPGPDAIGYAVGYAAIKLMVRQQPDAFGRWIRAVKGGKPWEQALSEDFGHSVDAFAPTVEQWYRTKN